MNSRDLCDIFFVQSTNSGVNWTTNPPVRVNTDSTTNDQWMPAIAVRPDGNQLFIGWLDRRGDTNNSMIDAYGRWGTIATNGAVTFFTNDFRITSQSFPPAFAGASLVNTNQGYYDPVWPPGGVELGWWYGWWDPEDLGLTTETLPDGTGLYSHEAGEHNGASADMDRVYLVWSDNRVHWSYQGTNSYVQGTGRYQADVRLARLPWPP